MVDRGGPREPDLVPAGGPTFAEARAELEAIVGRLERGEAELEEAVVLWERGEELYRLCLAKLDAATGLVEELGRDGAVSAIDTGPAAGGAERVRAPDAPAASEPAAPGDG